jgi:radical SAM-linked protein
VQAYRASLPEDQAEQVTDLPAHVYDLEDPLPWDFIDTGIDPQWLKDDWERALQAATVPDCSFESCSHCGICGLDFGHNIVLPPPPIPAVQKQQQQRDKPVQRLRLTFAKQGNMRFVGHLDLLRLWERACRRARLPLAFTGGFHPSPRIATASALSLGYASTGEIVDLELTEWRSPQDCRAALERQLPSDVPLLAIAEIPLDAPSATRSLVAADYELHLQADRPVFWPELVQHLLASETIWLEKTSKSGKILKIDGRSQLYQLELVHTMSSTEAVLHYRGSCRNDGTLLRPEQVAAMLAHQLDGTLELQILRVTRQGLVLQV